MFDCPNRCIITFLFNNIICITCPMALLQQWIYHLYKYIMTTIKVSLLPGHYITTIYMYHLSKDIIIQIDNRRITCLMTLSQQLCSLAPVYYNNNKGLACLMLVSSYCCLAVKISIGNLYIRTYQNGKSVPFPNNMAKDI